MTQRSQLTRACRLLAAALLATNACGGASEPGASRANPNDASDDDASGDDDPSASDANASDDDPTDGDGDGTVVDDEPSPSQTPSADPATESTTAPAAQPRAMPNDPSSAGLSGGGTAGTLNDGDAGTSTIGGQAGISAIGGVAGVTPGGAPPASEGGAGGTEPMPMGCVDCEVGFECFEELDPGRCLEVCATESPDVLLQTQAEVDRFAALGCEVVTGDLVVEGPEVESLRGLEHLRVIEGSLLVRETELLEDLSGLEGLGLLIEGLSVDENVATRNVSALKNAQADQAFIHMNGNVALENLDGLQGFRHPDYIQFTDNHSLTDLSDLSPESTGALYFSSNQAFANARFEKLRTIDVALTFLGELACQTLELPQLEAVGGGIIISGNTDLREIDFSLLAGADSMIIASNDSLETLGGLPSLMSVPTSMAIARNPSLPQCEVDEIGARFESCACAENDLEATCE